MSLYDEVLPGAFGHKLTVTKEEAKKIVAFLIDKGSSFAVTADRPTTIWFSEASWLHFSESVSAATASWMGERK